MRLTQLKLELKKTQVEKEETKNTEKICLVACRISRFYS